MRMIYDREVDALEIRLSEGTAARTVHLDGGTLVDLNAEGELLAIEVIRPARPWPLDQILDDYVTDAATALLLRTLEPTPNREHVYGRRNSVAATAVTSAN
jgi:uncharacterized protein YuzE